MKFAAIAIFLAVASPSVPNDEAAAASPTGPTEIDQLFTEANRLFNAARSEADLRQAVENYRAILDRGIQNGRLYFNLGNAHLRLKEYGPAILNLRRALLYLPSDPWSLRMIESARAQVTDTFPEGSEKKALRAFLFWHYQTSFATRLWATLAAHSLFWLLLTLGLFTQIPFRRTCLVGLAVLGLAAGISAGVEGVGRGGEDVVVVLPEVEVRTGPGAGYELFFAKPIHSGVEAIAIETRGNWASLEFPGGVRGWTQGSAVERVVPITIQ